MKIVLRFLKRLFCKHEYVQYNTYMRTCEKYDDFECVDKKIYQIHEYECSKCGKKKIKEELIK